MSNTVLIIDDERWFFEPILERLEYEGIEYFFCTTGYEGLIELKSKDYKLVVLDMKIPLGKELTQIFNYEAEGIYILEEIRKIKATQPVICHTTLADQVIINKILDLGGKYIPKGSSGDDLIDEIKKIIQLRRNNNEI